MTVIELWPIPWQPSYLLTRDTLDLLGRASELAGHNIQVDDAFRTYAAQKALYDGWINRVPGYNFASNPDDPNGQNNHRRAAAVDIVNHNDRQYMLAAGFTPDGAEWWHFNNPNWRNMPVINDYTVAGTPANVGNVTVINNTEDWKTQMDEAWEYFKIVGDTTGTIYVSWNRTGYWGMSGQTFTDHQYWLANTKKVAVPAVQSVKNAQAFGPRLSS